MRARFLASVIMSACMALAALSLAGVPAPAQTAPASSQAAGRLGDINSAPAEDCSS